MPCPSKRPPKAGVLGLTYPIGTRRYTLFQMRLLEFKKQHEGYLYRQDEDQAVFITFKGFPYVATFPEPTDALVEPVTGQGNHSRAHRSAMPKQHEGSVLFQPSLGDPFRWTSISCSTKVRKHLIQWFDSTREWYPGVVLPRSTLGPSTYGQPGGVPIAPLNSQVVIKFASNPQHGRSQLAQLQSANLSTHSSPTFPRGQAITARGSGVVLHHHPESLPCLKKTTGTPLSHPVGHVLRWLQSINIRLQSTTAPRQGVAHGTYRFPPSTVKTTKRNQNKSRLQFT